MSARLLAYYLLILTLNTVTNAYSQDLPDNQPLDSNNVIVPLENIPVPDPLQTGSMVTDPVPTEQPAVSVQPPAAAAVPVAPMAAAGKQDKTRSTIILVAAVILFLTLGALIVLLIKRGRFYKQASDPHVSEAYLYDLNGRTSEPRYKLGKKATMFGRVPGKDSDHLDYIVIPESTIGRRHATIEYKDYAYWIMDQGSINGTFVNNTLVTSEIRLKHGDRIRLHKIEFDFIMPDMEEAGMTRIADHPADADAANPEEDVDAIKSSMAGQAFDLDLGIGDEESPAKVAQEIKSDETILPGFGADIDKAERTDDATLIPDYDYAKASKPAAKTSSASGKRLDSSESKPAAKASAFGNMNVLPDDQTLMHNNLPDIDEDVTIRPDSDGSSDGIFDITGSDKKDR